MKLSILSSILLIASVSISFSQEVGSQCIPLIGEKAPSFNQVSTMGNINFPMGYPGKWKILFSHPGDFTAICSTEILELAAMQEDFTNLNTSIFVISTDGLNSHLEWIRSLESIEIKDKDFAKINFPLISDTDMSVSKKYGMVHQYTSTTKDIRGVFIINPDDKIAAIFYYPNKIGRNMEEIKRTLIALQTAEKYNVLTPANWEPGEDVMIPSPVTIEDSKKLEDKKGEDIYMKTWYMWYKKLPDIDR
jgi:peroxiredoxin (alkyl hydroperoxide reductase subunit C)